jgi:TRAP-type C4-dicarboxylate transport system substrate-binding protein
MRRRQIAGTGARRRLRVFALVAVAAIVAAGCTAAAGGGDKAGGGGAPVVLKMAEGTATFETDPAVADFVRRVQELSAGALRINVVPEWGAGPPDGEQQTVRDVGAGKADLGSVGTRVFDTLGVNSFQALTAPMLIDSYPLERAVLSSEVPEQMLAGLQEAGVVGLGVLANGLRRPIAVNGPFLGPADWRGIVFDASRSEGQAEGLRALGARSTDVTGAALTEGLKNGEVQGAENNLLVYRVNGRETAAPYVTANVTLWPKMTALLANRDSFSRLTVEQREWLRRAAHDSALASTGLFEREDGIVADLCASGARFANASQGDLAALRQAFAPVYASLEQDPQTKSFIQRIEALKQVTPAGPALAIPAGCTGSVPPPDDADDPIAGTWTTAKLSESQIVRAFVSGGGSEKGGHEFFYQLGGGSTHYAVITLTFEDGLFSEYESGDGRPPVDATGGHPPYAIGEDGTLNLGQDPATGCADTYRIDIRRDTLRLHVAKRCPHSGPIGVTLYASFPFTRSG